MVGLAALGISILHYLLVVIPNQAFNVPSLWLEDRVWMGCLLIAFMALVEAWYRGLKLRGVELLLKPMIHQGLIIFIFTILSAMILADSRGPVQSLLLLLSFGGLFALGEKLYYSLLTWIGAGSFLFVVINFLLRDLKVMPESDRLVIFFVLAAFFIILGLYVAWVEHHFKKPITKHKRH